MEVKVIDFIAPPAASDFANGLKEIGFAVIKNHPINQQLIDQVYEQWYEFFRSADKENYTFDSKTHDGFISTELSETAKGYDAKDLKEFYHYYPWGRCPESLRAMTQQMYGELNQMAETLLQWVQQEAPQEVTQQLSMPLDEMIKNSDHTLLRLIHYPPLTGDEPAGALRAASHEDINLLTLLPAATAKGLQVQDANGNWLDVPCDPGWIIVNVGDMLQECTGHYYPSTPHRVINPTGQAALESRLSMPLFLHPRADVRLSQRHTAESYRQERFAELGLKE